MTDRLPGMSEEESAIDEIEIAAKNYDALRRKKNLAGDRERAGRDELIHVMHKYDRDTYHFQGLIVQLIEDEKVKVKIPEAEK